MWVFAIPDSLVSQCHTLVNAEAMLFVDDDQRQFPERDSFLE